MLRDGQFWYASSYVASSIIIGLLATYTGIMITKLL
jgi:fluoride ion exporter CrcB/FEX